MKKNKCKTKRNQGIETNAKSIRIDDWRRTKIEGRKEFMNEGWYEYSEKRKKKDKLKEKEGKEKEKQMSKEEWKREDRQIRRIY